MKSLATAMFVFALVAHVAAQEAAPEAKPAFSWKAHPTFRLGHMVQLEAIAKFQEDGRTSDALIANDDGGTFDMARRRVGVEGEIAKLAQFRVERELSGGGVWKDVYVNYRQFDKLQLQGGNFKLPFGLEENTGSTDLDFVYRSRVATQLAPGRDPGVMAHGRLIDRVVRYEAGVFEHDGRNARTASDTRVYGGATFAARLDVEPFRASKSALRSFMAGAAFTTSDVPEGFPGLRGQTALGDTFFSSKIYVNGARLREGIEMRWRPGPWQVQSEYIRATDQRHGESVADTDLAPFLADGWYLSGSVLLTGEHRTQSLPERPLFRGGFGAVDLAARVERLSFGSVGGGGPSSSSPRSDSIQGNSDHVTTVGVNWYVNRWVKIQGNLIHDNVADPARGPLPDRSGFWSRVALIQFVL